MDCSFVESEVAEGNQEAAEAQSDCTALGVRQVAADAAALELRRADLERVDSILTPAVGVTKSSLDVGRGLAPHQGKVIPDDPVTVLAQMLTVAEGQAGSAAVVLSAATGQAAPDAQPGCLRMVKKQK